jgi:hypothetical protein
MKLNSKYFDSIRIAKKDEPKPVRQHPPCQWKGCGKPAEHRAPKGRGRDGEYFAFCIDHVRQYNATYNYFNGMSDAEVEDFQKDAITGHRPTWRLGENAAASGSDPATGATRYARFASGAIDPHELLQRGVSQEGAEKPRRALRPLERKALETLHLSEPASKDQIKTRFKELVKRHHPDANGGDRGSEDVLREIIQAYNYLKQAGLV